MQQALEDCNGSHTFTCMEEAQAPIQLFAGVADVCRHVKAGMG